MNSFFTIKQEDHDKITLSEEISVVGYMVDLEEGCKLISRGGGLHDFFAQGWKAF